MFDNAQDNTIEDFEPIDEEEEYDDLTDVPDNILPEAGWHKARTVLAQKGVTKSSGTEKRSVQMILGGNYYHWENYNLGMDGMAGEIAWKNYKDLAKACGCSPNPQGEFKIKMSDLQDEELYVFVKVKKDSDFPVNIAAYKPIDTENPPDDIVGDASAEEEDGLPF